MSFIMNTFVVNENEGTVDVCLLLTGELERSINVTVTTVPGTALGRSAVHLQTIIFTVFTSI